MDAIRPIIDALIKDIQSLTADCLLVQLSLKHITDREGLEIKESDGNFILPSECIPLVNAWSDYLDKIELGIKAVRSLGKKRKLKIPAILKDIEKLQRKEREFIKRCRTYHFPVITPDHHL